MAGVLGATVLTAVAATGGGSAAVRRREWRPRRSRWAWAGGLEGSVWLRLACNFCLLTCLCTSLRVYLLLCEENAWMSENKRALVRYIEYWEGRGGCSEW